MPVGLRGVAGDAQIQPPFTLPFRRGDHVLTVGWAILRPQPAFATRDSRLPKSPSGKFGFMTRSLRQQAALA
jgi:hypothetical protein